MVIASSLESKEKGNATSIACFWGRLGLSGSYKSKGSPNEGVDGKEKMGRKR